VVESRVGKQEAGEAVKKWKCSVEAKEVEVCGGR